MIASQAAAPWWVDYLLPIMAILVAPLAGIRVTNFLKRAFQLFAGDASTSRQRAARWLLYNATHFLVTGALATLCWWVKFPTWREAALVGFMVAAVQTGIVAVLFWLVGRASPELSEKLSDGFAADDPPTLFSAVAGRRRP